MDKRLYKRENVDLESVFYFECDGNQIEFLGQIKNISEGGIAIAVSDEKYKAIVAKLNPGKKLDFVSCAEYELFGQNISAVISNQVMVIRKDLVDDIIVIGCEVIALSREYEKYVREIKMSRFVNKCHE